MADLLRTTNTYHSNLIEGHDTRPRDIERALDGHLSTTSAKRSLQIEERAHVEVQPNAERRMESEEVLDITSTEFLLFLHRAFYERMPEEWRIIRSADGTRERAVVPGRLRDEEVDVGSSRSHSLTRIPVPYKSSRTARERLPRAVNGDG